VIEPRVIIPQGRPFADLTDRALYQIMMDVLAGRENQQQPLDPEQEARLDAATYELYQRGTLQRAFSSILAPWR